RASGTVGSRSWPSSWRRPSRRPRTPAGSEARRLVRSPFTRSLGSDQGGRDGAAVAQQVEPVTGDAVARGQRQRGEELLLLRVDGGVGAGAQRRRERPDLDRGGGRGVR